LVLSARVWIDLETPLKLFLGFSSRTFAKKSWKIDFNEFFPHRDFYGLKKLGLKANSQDMSLQRSLHESDLLRAVGVASARSGYANVFVNSMNFGKVADFTTR
jgi:hypothetical protein